MVRACSLQTARPQKRQTPFAGRLQTQQFTMPSLPPAG